jgi:S-adenosylmethionine:tRNA ribosyltransferase-isomerase
MMSSSPPIELFDYDLPEELIAQRPAEKRTGSRLLRMERNMGSIEHMMFEAFPDLLRENDLLVLNNTKVFPARLMVKRATGGLMEILLLEYPSDEGETVCLVRPGRRVKKEEEVYLEDGSVLLVSRAGDRFTVSGNQVNLRDVVQIHGQVPLPPYISRGEEGPDETDTERYQTVFAGHPGAVAAPTAGLHFDDEMLVKIGQKGVRIGQVTLHVGPGTFQPIRTSRITNHRMETEAYDIPEETARLIHYVMRTGGRIVAVGTTVVRTLESAWDGQQVPAGEGKTGLFIYPEYRFQVVDALLTNFHLPRSTLIMLVCAFGETEPVMKAYREAVKEKYRFYSYGDVMFIE